MNSGSRARLNGFSAVLGARRELPSWYDSVSSLATSLGVRLSPVSRVPLRALTAPGALKPAWLSTKKPMVSPDSAMGAYTGRRPDGTWPAVAGRPRKTSPGFPETSLARAVSSVTWAKP